MGKPRVSAAKTSATTPPTKLNQREHTSPLGLIAQIPMGYVLAYLFAALAAAPCIPRNAMTRATSGAKACGR